MNYQILYKGENTMIKERHVFYTIYKILSEKDFNTITIEKVIENDTKDT